MSFSVVGSVNHLVAEYRRFLLSTYRLADKKLRDQFEEHIKMRAEGVKGTKAILLYSMNALANDQLSRLRNLIRDSGVGVTFAMYTGESESVAATLGEPVEGNEFICRSEIQEQQPDILLTNYKQLEFLLVRKEDRPLFSPSLRFLVLDEIHSYRGALATRSPVSSEGSRRGLEWVKANCAASASPSPTLLTRPRRSRFTATDSPSTERQRNWRRTPRNETTFRARAGWC
jgi:hypothetical protein